MAPDEVWIGPEGLFAATCLLAGDQTGGSFSVVQHLLAPGILAAPPHRHRDEDEFSYVVEGVVAFQLENEVQTASAGAIVSKPKGQMHTFWNPSQGPARILELITPPGFEDYFTELADIVPKTPGEVPDFGRLSEAAGRHGLEFDMDSLGSLMAAQGVRLPGM